MLLCQNTTSWVGWWNNKELDWANLKSWAFERLGFAKDEALWFWGFRIGCLWRKRNYRCGFLVFCEGRRSVACVFVERDLEGFRFSIRQFFKGEGSRAEVRCDFEGICVLDWDCDCDCDFAGILSFFPLDWGL